MSRRVVLGSDHGGFPLKEALKSYVQSRGFAVLDVGTWSTETADYPTFAKAVAEAVAAGQAWRGVIIDGAGIGSCMVANKIPGVRAGMAFNTATANNAREHNDANVLTLGAGYLSEADAKAIIDVFLSVECTVDRHKRRVAMIDALDAPSSNRSPSPMPSFTGDAAALTEAIARVLTANPGLLQPAGVVPAGAPGFQHTTCNPSCKSCTGSCSKRAATAVRDVLGASSGARISAKLGATELSGDLASMIDHTLLKADATYAELDRLCDEARKCGFKSVCVNPLYVQRCAERLRGASAVVCTVIGFPLGATPTQVKVLEARRALRDGAREIDMVIAIGALKSGDVKHVYEDIRAVVEVARESNAICKVIIETSLLTDEQKVTACVLAKRARAHFVKTSTGFSTGGATVEDVALMAQAVDYKLEVKASGGVRSREDAEKMVAAGATRIGASVGVKIAGCDVPGSAPAGSGY